MDIAVVGTGYVGLVTGACFAEMGVNITCIDINEEKIKNLQNGIIPIYEPGLEQIVKQNTKTGRLQFNTDISKVINKVDIIFSAVGTPPQEDGSADLQYVLEVAKSIGQSMTGYKLIVTKSTVPVGTAQKVRSAIQKELDLRKVVIQFDVASNPEFLKEGNAVRDFMHPDRIVVGTDSKKVKDLMTKLYKPFTLNGHPLLFMDIISAEITKYAANAMLATRISFMNEIANLCDIVGADINHVRKGIASDPRIGSQFLYAGCGYGGSCFPKDVKALFLSGKEMGYHMQLIEAIDAVNERQKEVLFNKIRSHFGNTLTEKTIAIWGLSFKPETDDMREAPAVVVINQLLAAGCIVKVYDPIAMSEAYINHFGNNVQYCNDKYDAIDQANAVVLITEWKEFRIPNWNIMRKLMKNHILFDGRNIYDRQTVEEEGFTYEGIGTI